MTALFGADTLASLQAVRYLGPALGGGRRAVQNVKIRLDAWRDAERRRDALALDSAEWQEAVEEVRNAEKAFHAELAQVSARYAEDEFLHLNRGLVPHLDRRTSRARD